MLTSFIAQTGDVSGDWRRGAEEARLNFCCFESRLVAKPCTTLSNPFFPFSSDTAALGIG